MTTTSPDALINEIGELAERLGWTLVHVERSGTTGVGFVFEQNASPYGAQSSVHRAKARTAVLSDLMGQQALETIRVHRESQGILTRESGGFPDESDL
jgi:hypothetical protein